MWRKRAKRLILGMVLLVGLAGVFFGFRAYKLRRVEIEAGRYATWVKDAVLETNPVQFIKAYGSDLYWFGHTNITVMMRSPTGAEFTINALIESSLLGTRLVQLDLYHRGGPPVDTMSVEEMGRELFSDPSGIRVDLPVEIVDAGAPLDLTALLPSAFASLDR